MIVTLNQSEIEHAIVNYVNSHAVATADKQIEIGLTAGRKGNGFSATVSIAANSKVGSIRAIAASEGIDMPTEFVSKEVENEIEEETEDANIFGAA